MLANIDVSSSFIFDIFDESESFIANNMYKLKEELKAKKELIKKVERPL